jgi:hypothetical protein
VRASASPARERDMVLISPDATIPMKSMRSVNIKKGDKSEHLCNSTGG